MRRLCLALGAVVSIGCSSGPRAVPEAQPAGPAAPPQPIVLDDFDSVAAWTASPSDGVSLRITSDSGWRGRAMRLDFDFHGHGGYAVAHRSLPAELPENYAFRFRIRADAPVNNLEFKLIDSTGDNVWWVNRRDYHFPREWTEVVVRKRQVAFAWGPRGGGELHHLAALEFAVTAGQGGTGTVWIDQLTLTRLPPPHPYRGTPLLTAGSAAPGHPAALALDGDTATEWRSAPGRDSTTVTVDFGEPREYGGLILDWDHADFAADYTVEQSSDGADWTAVYPVERGNGGRDYLWLPESDSRFLRLRLRRSSRGQGFALREILVQPLTFGDSLSRVFQAAAADAPPGSYPRYFSNQQSYWTVVGVSGGRRVALFNTDGAVEPARGSFSIEPFLGVDGRLISWRDAASVPSLARGDLPVPSVRWTADSLTLTTTVFADGQPGQSTLYSRYRVENRTGRPRQVRLYLAIRPFQVNPPWQFLGTPGGPTPIRRLAWNDGAVAVGDSLRVVPLRPPARFGAATFDQGDITEYLRRQQLPGDSAVTDRFGYASGAMLYRLDLPAGGSAEVYLAVPPDGVRRPPATDSADASAALRRTERRWAEELDRVGISLPGDGAEIVRTVRSSLAWILIERNGPAFQPGTRSYARSWIRDGAMISAALLRLGHAAAVRDFIEWYAPYQYPSGKVPCCVDQRGADPVPENDSNGEFIFMIADYVRITGDTALLQRLWPRVERAAGYIDSLRAERMTPEYASGDRRVFYGLVPASISHEGYSAKPMHSYWDDLWALAGLRDASHLATLVGDTAAARRIGASARQMGRDIAGSVRLSMAGHDIDYIPGAAELGDFDPTSTTIALAPTGTRDVLPDSALRATFERYWREKKQRETGAVAWENYTPYELRQVGAFVRLGWRARADSLLRFFLEDRRPAAWNQWAEVVWHDSTTPRFIGDMPHAWVASDYIRSVLAMLAYVRAADSALVVGAGVAPSWLADGGVRVTGLATRCGPLSYRMWAEGATVRVRIAGGLRLPPAGVVVSPPGRRTARVTVNGRRVPADSTGAVTVHRLPAELVFR